MARVSLIMPLERGPALDAERAGAWRERLERAGHSVEILGVLDPRALEDPVDSGDIARTIVAEEAGLVAGAIFGLGEARGDVLVVVDHARGYSGEDLARVVEPILRGEAELVVGSRAVPGEGGLRRARLTCWTGALARRLIGSSDPLSGLLAVAHAPASWVDLGPTGSLMTLELLSRTVGRRLDVAASPASGRSRRPIELDDVRHLKRLADDRFGNASRLVQFCMVGASGMLIDLSSYALFQWVFSRTGLAALTTPIVGGPLSLAVSGALAIAVALTWNFSLNRRLTFSYARRGSLIRQFVGYALSNALGIGLSFLLRLYLPAHVAFFDRHRLAAALVGIVSATGISFSMSRWLVFGKRHADPRPSGRPRRPAADEEATTTHVMSRSLSASSCEPL